MRLVSRTGVTILAIDYRLSPEHPWPAPVDDCLEAYKWCLTQGQRSEDIVFAGDSAGGGLVLATMASAKAQGVPLPAAGILWSPWLDLADCRSGSWTTNLRWDWVQPDPAIMFAKMYAGDRSLKAVSPGNVGLDGLPPLLVEWGQKEVLHDQIAAFVARARAAGVDVESHVGHEMVHVYMFFALLTDRHSPARAAFERVATFLDRVMGSETGTLAASPAAPTPLDAQKQPAQPPAQAASQMAPVQQAQPPVQVIQVPQMAPVAVQQAPQVQVIELRM